MKILARMEASPNCEASQTISAFAVLACALPALLLATACLLPFLNKAFNVDDSWFLTMAQQIVRHPAHPMDFEICWNIPLVSGRCVKAAQFSSGNPLMGQIGQGYVLVPTALSGAHEWTAHLTQLVLVWIAVLAMTSLVFRFGWDRRHAIIGALLLVAIPPFLPMASTAMPEILATAVALVAVERLAAWKTEHKWGQGAAAAVALGLAGFARPHLVLLLPLAAVFLLESTDPREIMRQIRRRFWLWSPVFAGFGFLLAIILAAREHSFPIDHLPVTAAWRNIPKNLFSYLLYIAFPLPLAAGWLANCLKIGRLRVAAIWSVLAIAPGFLRWNHPLASLFAVAGFAALTDLCITAWRKRSLTDIFLLLWILIPLPIVIYVQLPMKYLLPCMPAVILLCFRLMDGVPFRVARATALVLIVASTGYSLLILRSDNEFADFGRDALHRLIAPRVAAGERVWYPGQYWSFWYAPLYGARLTFPGGPQPKPGDLLVVDLLAGQPQPLLVRFPHRTLVQRVSHRYSFGRTMGPGVGLYSNRLGYWLWGFGGSDKDRFELWRID